MYLRQTSHKAFDQGSGFRRSFDRDVVAAIQRQYTTTLELRPERLAHYRRREQWIFAAGRLHLRSRIVAQL